MISDVLDPEREREERESEPEQPETAPEEEPGVTAPEPETLPAEPDINLPDSAGQENLDGGRSTHVGTHSRTGRRSTPS